MAISFVCKKQNGKTNLNQFDKLSEKYSYYASFSKRKHAGVAILSRFIPIKVMHGFGISKIDEEAQY